MASSRLPRNATLDEGESEKIVLSPDPSILESVLTYWELKFLELGETVLEGLKDSDTPAMKFALTLPNEPITDIFTGRPHVLREDQSIFRGGDSLYILKEAGCLMSTDELAEWLNKGSNADALTNDIHAFVDAATVMVPTLDVENAPAARGLLAVRELYDIARRFHFAKQNAEATGLSVAECLALHRAEGAFAVTPPKDSFPFGPLVQTKPKLCRTNRVTHALNKTAPETVERPGFVLVIPINEYFSKLGIAGENTNLSYRFETLLTNLLVTGGLDCIAAWMPENKKYDEMQLLIGHAYDEEMSRAETTLGLASASEASKKDLHKHQKGRLILILSANLMMVRIEDSETLPDPLTLFFDALIEAKRLIDAHEVEVVRRGGRTDVHLVGNGSGGETSLVLRIQCLWYASRKNPSTLLARRDRVGSLKSMKAFSPFTAYLRYHTGDPIFMGILLRMLQKLPALYELAKKKGMKQKKHPWGKAFVDAVDKLSLKKFTATGVATINAYVTHWKKVNSTRGIPGKRPNQETMWRHLGLIDELMSGGSAPSWLVGAATPDLDVTATEEQTALYTNLLKTADVAKETVELIEKYDLMNVINTGLETIPIDVFVNTGILLLPERSASDIPGRFMPKLTPAERLREWLKVEARAPLVKAHNFERLRLVYQQTWDSAFGGP